MARVVAYLNVYGSLQNSQTNTREFKINIPALPSGATAPDSVCINEEYLSAVSVQATQAIAAFNRPLARMPSNFQGVLDGPVHRAQAPEPEEAQFWKTVELWLPGVVDGQTHSALAPEPAAAPAAVRELGKRKREPESEPESHGTNSADDKLDPLIEKAREDAPLLAHMESIDALKHEFADVDNLLLYMAACIYKKDNQPLDIAMYTKCFERISRTKAFLENCVD